MKLGLVLALPLLAISCTSGSPKPTTPKVEAPTADDYILGPGKYETKARIKTPQGEIAIALELEQTCDVSGAELSCTTMIFRRFEDQRLGYETRSVTRESGIHEVYYKDDKIEKTYDALAVPTPSSLPHSWTKPSPDREAASCRAESIDSPCMQGILVRCETGADDGTTSVDARVYCPDNGKTLHRSTVTYSDLCESVMDITYLGWSGEPASDAEALDTTPVKCEQTTPLGWTHQTPNRRWSVALPARGRMVLGPDKHTVNLHVGEMSFIAYEGTGVNASVKTDADIPVMAEHLETTVAPILNATVGQPVKNTSAFEVDWTIPLATEDGKHAGALRLIAHDGRTFSLTTTGPDKTQGDAFLGSFAIRDEAFATSAATEFAQYIADGGKYRDEVCACKDVECAKKVVAPAVPARGFPTAAEEEAIAKMSADLDVCAGKLMAPK